MARRSGSGSRARSGGALRGVLFLVTGALLVVAAMLVTELTGFSQSTTAAPVRIPRGASVRAIADSLASAGVISSPRAFRWYVSLTRQDASMKPGRYEFVQGQRWATVIDALVEGRAVTRTVVIPEGLDLRAIAPLIASALEVPVDSVVAAARDSAWIAKLDVRAETLEGYLFPATYAFASGTSAREAVTAMLERFESVWKPEWDSQLQAMSISRHDAMTMASIVEKEARVPAERPIIAAVYWNRIKKGMRLQADPTVQYALPAHTGRVLYKDLEIESPYNTYRNDGLPPGPIASPGEAAIAAAISPANVPYLFFVAHPDGHHEFRTTFAEHQRAIVEVRRAARAQK